MSEILYTESSNLKFKNTQISYAKEKSQKDGDLKKANLGQFWMINAQYFARRIIAFKLNQIEPIGLILSLNT